ncbi:hypothetical protein COOONC_24677 [Cooperia oncophora]
MGELISISIFLLQFSILTSLSEKEIPCRFLSKEGGDSRTGHFRHRLR